MRLKIIHFLKLLPAALLILIAAVFVVGQQSSETKQNTRPVQPAISSAAPLVQTEIAKPAQFFYEFTQPQFYIRHIVIEHNEKGIGSITFERQNEETPIKEEFELSPAARQRVLGLWQSLRFLDSEEDYQASRQYPHLGTMHLRMEQEARKRTVEFNWTSNKDAFALVNEYRRAADQAIFVFDVSVARENQPLNSPKLMDQLEALLKRNAISDPQQLVPLLQDITGDEHLPLIARNHAARILKQLGK